MNFAAQVEDHLRDLGAEARKVHPGVKEASERAILNLRSLQTQYVAAVRRAGASTIRRSSKSVQPRTSQEDAGCDDNRGNDRKVGGEDHHKHTGVASEGTPPQHPTTSLFRSQDVLHPFLLAANYPDASYALLVIALESIQLLLRGDAVRSEDGMHISRILGIQAWGCAGSLFGWGVAAGGTSNGGAGIFRAVGGANGTRTRDAAADLPSSSSLSKTTSGMAAGMIHAASSSVSGALGGITGIVLGSTTAITGGARSGNVKSSSPVSAASVGSSYTGPTFSHYHHYKNRSLKEDESIALKILQTVTMLVDSRSIQLTQEVLGTCLLACLLLGAGRFHPSHLPKSDNLGPSPSNVAGGNSLSTSNSYVYSSSYSPSVLLGYHSSTTDTDASRGTGISSTVTGVNSEGVPAGNVRRAALATMNQILSILFERARDSMNCIENTHGLISEKESTILSVALQTLSDLCSVILHSPKDTQGQPKGSSQLSHSGPFSIASNEGLSPTPTTSLALIEMIFKQRCRDFTQVCERSRCETRQSQPRAQNRTDPGANFARQALAKVCNLVLCILHSQQAFYYGTLDSGIQLPLKDLKGNDSSHASNSILSLAISSTPMDFCLFYYATALASTILTHTLASIPSSLPSGIDATVESTKDNNDDNIEKMNLRVTVRDMIKLLIGFVNGATEAYHQSDYFEDGYIFSQNERESLNIGKVSASSTNPTPSLPPKPPLPGSTAQLHPDLRIPDEKLWRALLSLEVLHRLISLQLDQIVYLDYSLSYLGNGSTDMGEGDNQEQTGESSHESTVGLIAEAASDFATISASNRERILHVVLTAHDDTNLVWKFSDLATVAPANVKSLGDDSSTKCKATSVVGDSTSSVEVSSSSISMSSMPNTQFLEPPSVASSLATKLSDAQLIDSLEIPHCDSGAATWLSFKCILSLIRSMRRVMSLKGWNCVGVDATGGTPSAITQRDSSNLEATSGRSLLDGSFGPSLSVLQHFIKRIHGSRVIVSQTLHAYEELAYASMITCYQPNNLRRRAILSSLCKLSLPSWGKRRANSQLKENHVDSLLAIVQIIHSHFDDILGEWHVILSTFDQLAAISISSPKLPVCYTDKATTIAECYLRLPRFTTCFSSATLSHFISSLVELSQSVSYDKLFERISDPTGDSRSNVTNEGANDSIPTTEGNLDIVSRDSSFGGKLMSFAGRAFGGGPAPSASSVGTISLKPLPEGGNASQQRSSMVRSSKTYSEDFREVTYLQMIASMKITTPRVAFQKLPLPLLLLTAVTEANSYRFSTVEVMVAAHLCDLVAKSPFVEVRSFAMDILVHLVPLSLSDSEISLTFGNKPIAAPAENTGCNAFNIISFVDGSDVTKTQLSHEIDLNSSSPCRELQLLMTLCETIQNTSQVETAENGLNAIYIVLEGAGHILLGKTWTTVVKTISALSGCHLPKPDSGKAVDRSAKMWANASALAFQNLKLIVDDFLQPMPTLSGTSPKAPGAHASILDCCVAFGMSRHDVNTSLTAIGMLWSLADQDDTPGTLDLVLSKLALLARDNRPEVRNCSVNTLFSCVVGLGHRFTNEQWEECLNKTIFGIMNCIAHEIDGPEHQKAIPNGNTHSQRYKVAIHHSRDSASKQWANTQVLTLRGFERVLRMFFFRLVSTTSNLAHANGNVQTQPWFLKTWEEILRISLLCATQTGERETLDLRLAGMELILLCVQLSCKAGMDATTTTARVSTNMEVVGGALRSVRAATNKKVKNQAAHEISTPLEPIVDGWREVLFHSAFAMLSDFKSYLEQTRGKQCLESDSQFVSVDSVLTQVLTKLSGELPKVYECCKKDEMSPGSCELRLVISIGDSSNYESQFIDLLLATVSNATSDKNSRYLSQVERSTISLLQTMASNSSLRSFEALINISGGLMFMEQKTISLNSIDDEDDVRVYGELFKLEAANTVAKCYESGNISDEVKVVVMFAVLSQYLKVHGFSGHYEKKSSSPKKIREHFSMTRYDILTRVIESGLQATSNIDTQTSDKVILDSIWDRIIATMSSFIYLLDDIPHEGYAHHSKSFVDILTVLLSCLPARKHSVVESILCEGANQIIGILLNSDAEVQQVLDGAIEIFKGCLVGLGQLTSTTSTVSSFITSPLRDAITFGDKSSLDNCHTPKVRISLALAICEGLKTIHRQDLLIETFPLLCRLTNVESDELRRAAGKVLGEINLTNAIFHERQRAEQAEMKATEIEEENNALLEEIEDLQAENDELQRQLAVFSESSDFI